MLRKLLFAALFALPMVSVAQSEWELPDSKSNKSNVSSNQKEEEVSKTIDPKYAKGTVPLVDGKVVWDYTIKVPGASSDDIFNRTMVILEELTKQEFSKPSSRLTAVNKKEHIIAAYFAEEMIFSQKVLAKDFCEFRYTVIATAKDGELNIRLCRITYLYDIARDNEAVYTAQELITDEEALNKDFTKMYSMPGKFRRATINRKDAVFSFIEEKITK